MLSFLTEDTKVITLLCGVFGQTISEKPLSPTEYSSLAQWLLGEGLHPKDLLHGNLVSDAALGAGVDARRLKGLLGRGVQLGFVVEEWHRNGIWVMSRSDADYPSRLKQHLKEQAPPLLFGAGDKTLLKGGGLGVVGSRNVDQDGEAFARQVASLCARNGIIVVSGGARGVDQISMTAALEVGGYATGILADNLLKKSTSHEFRKGIADGRLMLISPYHPAARFTVGSAMGRNKLIYAMSDFGLVVSSDHNKGGTWAGAVEELKRPRSRSVFVRIGDETPLGNHKLLDVGAIPWPELKEDIGLAQQLCNSALSHSEKKQIENLTLFDSFPSHNDELKGDFRRTIKDKTERTSSAQENNLAMSVSSPKHDASLYPVVLPVLLDQIAEPASIEKLSVDLDVTKSQLRVWLDKAIAEGKVAKLTKPVRYQCANLDS
ncbi:MAG: DNA-processing protein DprA [Gordonibacter sp.]|uniref:DNA-processing protein DprA n=1 Tax=Gordonibacter sp. TaxID=1968902 RepID=UPI002FC5CD0E